MLVITRRVSEAFHIGDDVEVIVLGVKGNQIRIGIKAPKATPVHREEIYRKIMKERGLVAHEEAPNGPL